MLELALSVAERIARTFGLPAPRIVVTSAGTPEFDTVTGEIRIPADVLRDQELLERVVAHETAHYVQWARGEIKSRQEAEAFARVFERVWPRSLGYGPAGGALAGACASMLLALAGLAATGSLLDWKGALAVLATSGLAGAASSLF